MPKSYFSAGLRQITAVLYFISCFQLGTAQKAPEPYGAIPTKRQLAWHNVEMYGLVHFTPTTFENKEWGYGNADPAIFNPTAFNAEQIVKAAKAGGLRGLILVAKHHDGFCLFPTKTTEYNISKSPFRNGKGDMVKEFEQVCRKYKMKFGVYCSPWDRNNSHYGTPQYLEIYRKQLKELYSNYGELFMSWHDGANGGDGYYGGANEKRIIDRLQYYDWENTWKITRRLQPHAAIFSDVGLDVRWAGNEEGVVNETCWATYTPRNPDGTGEGAPGYSDYENAPTGTRNGKKWLPAECDVPLRKGWFYHPEEDSTVKPVEKLLDIYFKSVGRGAALDLGLAPDTRGLLHENDVKVLSEFGKALKQIFAINLAQSARIITADGRGKAFPVKYMTDNKRETYWASSDSITTPTIIFLWNKPITFNVFSLREAIQLGQRIEGFALDVWENNSWQEIHRGTSVGALRLVRLKKKYNTDKIRLRITQSPVCVTISELGFFNSGQY
ncbi:MAG: alpha-L-fucosidase [Chitinophagaceae bacterium]|nr:alpha-L-fucosidase [Chitinophagaceae bacterium]